MHQDVTHYRDDPTQRGRGRRWVGSFCLLLLPALCLLLTGCRGLGKPDVQYDLLTAELRTRERELLECRAERDHLRLLGQAYQRQLQYQHPAATCPPEGGAPSLPLREVSLGQLRRTWRSGLLSSGYFVPLQWERPPTTARMRLVARLTTLDGRDYEA